MTILNQVPVHRMIQKYIQDNPVELDDSMPVWDYLAEVGRKIRQTLTVPRPIIALMKELPLIKFLPNIPLFEARLKQLETDIKTFVEEYREIAEQHAGRFGYIESIDDNALSIKVGELYTLLSNRAAVAIEEILCHLVDMLNHAQARYVSYHQRHNLPYIENYIDTVIKRCLEELEAERLAQQGNAAAVQGHPQQKAF